MDLFKPLMPEKKLHASFRAVLGDPIYAPVMPIIQGWADGLLGRKGEGQKFIKEFQSTFNSSMWEMYLNKTLKDLNFSVDYSKSAPDFCITTPDGDKFNIEAVISDRNGKATLTSVSDSQEFKRRSALKLMGKMKDKLAIYRGGNGKKFPYSSLDHVRDIPFVVAIAPFDSDQSLMQNNELINLVLFGIDPPALPGEEFGQDGRVEKLKTTSGAEVDVGIFTNDSFKEFSAVIFSTVGTFGKAVVESGIKRIVRSTHYREIDKDLLPVGDRSWNVGERRFVGKGLEFLVQSRFDYGSQIAGSDVHIRHSDLHRETHFDGLHIYYNPYAQIPFNPEIFFPAEITHNFYDIEEKTSVHRHPDGALVSRHLFDPTMTSLQFLLQSYGF
ncbi:hypothetical protein [Sphingopyxis sp. R3-92]|uniref:hypothetical protein n=1 Tax=Sphingopyxis sp. R3-92 TaxID=3158553 RepID=UPI003EE61AC8